MNILLVNHYAGSPEMGMEYRPYYMAKEWVKGGHNVRIIAGSYSHVRTNQPPISKNFQEEDIDGISYVWIKTPKYQGNGLKRFYSMVVFVCKLLFKTSAILRDFKYDVVIASSTYPLDNIFVHHIAKKSNAIHVFEVHDLWPLSPIELGGLSKWHPFIIIMQWAENFGYKNAHHVVSILPKTKGHMIKHGMTDGKFNYVPNGIDIREWQEAEALPKEHRELLSKLQKNKQEIIGYVGGHALSNALDVLIKSASLVKENNVSFVMVGKGAEKNKLIKTANELGLNNVFFLPPVPKKSIKNLLSEMDILYIGWKKQPLYRFGISPNKLMDYMMSEKPILHSVEAGNDIVQEAKCGLTVPPENPLKIANGLSTLINMSDKERNLMGSRGKKYVLKNHDYKFLAKRMIEIVEKNLKPKI